MYEEVRMKNTEIKKIAIGGEIQIGKSTLVERLLTCINIPVSGFMTKLDRNAADEAGMFPLYIYPASMPKDQRENTPDNLLGACAGRNRHKAYTDRFDVLATSLITDIPEENVTVMDELGFLESEAEHFKAQVRQILSEDRYVIMVIKDRFDVQFLDELRSIPDVAYYSVTKENRDRLYEELAPVVRAWK